MPLMFPAITLVVAAGCQLKVITGIGIMVAVGSLVTLPELSERVTVTLIVEPISAANVLGN
ncbi:MAG: hypothetical protein FWD13_02330 [Treponema sp.]|nr:hypothetical protein [Treponema sp.]